MVSVKEITYNKTSRMKLAVKEYNKPRDLEQIQLELIDRCGECTGKAYRETDKGISHVGWVFEKVMPDYVEETWVEILNNE